MAITYPLTIPTNVNPVSSRIEARSVVSESTSPFSGASKIYSWSGQWWELEFTLPPMLRQDAEEWLSFLLKLNGKEGTFLAGDFDAVAPRGVATGTPLIKGASQTGNSILTDGWTPGTTGILKQGDYIQLGSASTSRLYKVLDDVDSDGSGNATLTVWPNLRSSPADNDAITTTNCKTQFRLSTNNVSWSSNSMQHYSLTIVAKESL